MNLGGGCGLYSIIFEVSPASALKTQVVAIWTPK
jgi:hypothetical protein